MNPNSTIQLNWWRHSWDRLSFLISPYESYKTVINKTAQKDEKAQYQIPCFHRVDFYTRIPLI